jgi:hypothetical protein
MVKTTSGVNNMTLQEQIALKLLEEWNAAFTFSKEGNSPKHNKAKYAVRNQWRSILEMCNQLSTQNRKQSEALKVAKEALEFYYYENNVRNNYCHGTILPDKGDDWSHFILKDITGKDVTLEVERGKRAKQALATIEEMDGL